MSSTPHGPLAVDLPPGGTVALRLARGALVRVLAGRAWITQEGDAHDWFLRCGESLRLPRTGRVVIEALSAVAIVVDRAEGTLDTRARRLAALLHVRRSPAAGPIRPPRANSTGRADRPPSKA
jgi:hypothetical protein